MRARNQDYRSQTMYMRPASPAGRARFRPLLEALEDRLTPTKFFPAAGVADGGCRQLRAAIITANGNGENDGICCKPARTPCPW